MGLDDRIALQRAGVDLADPMQRGIVDYASQPPLGARYYDTGAVNTGFLIGVPNTFDFRAVAGLVQYDPYNMIDMTNDRVKIDVPGFYDIMCEVFVDNMVAGGDLFFAEFVQGIVAPTGLREMSDFVRAPAAAIPARLLLHAHGIPMTRARINAGSYWYVRGTALTNNQNARIISFSIWMRSAYVPGKY